MFLFTKLIKPVYAHCDMPCGIYEIDTMRHAADTCLRMIEKIEALPENTSEKSDDHNNFVRMVVTKEKHAQLCKDQIYILWSDYFKPEHLHTKMWEAAKQCGKVKQSVSRSEAEKLVELVAGIVSMFEESKK
jgi:nickel superoxide dismutase